MRRFPFLDPSSLKDGSSIALTCDEGPPRLGANWTSLLPDQLNGSPCAKKWESGQSLRRLCLSFPHDNPGSICFGYQTSEPAGSNSPRQISREFRQGNQLPGLFSPTKLKSSYRLHRDCQAVTAWAGEDLPRGNPACPLNVTVLGMVRCLGGKSQIAPQGGEGSLVSLSWRCSWLWDVVAFGGFGQNSGFRTD